MNLYTVYWKGMGMLLYVPVAEKFWIADGYEIKTEGEFWDILRENCEFGIIQCRKEAEFRSDDKD